MLIAHHKDVRGSSVLNSALDGIHTRMDGGVWKASALSLVCRVGLRADQGPLTKTKISASAGNRTVVKPHVLDTLLNSVVITG